MKLPLKKCDECNKPCEFVESKTLPSASEWYCPRCHKSHDVPELAENYGRER